MSASQVLWTFLCASLQCTVRSYSVAVLGLIAEPVQNICWGEASSKSTDVVSADWQVAALTSFTKLGGKQHLTLWFLSVVHTGRLTKTGIHTVTDFHVRLMNTRSGGSH